MRILIGILFVLLGLLRVERKAQIAQSPDEICPEFWFCLVCVLVCFFVFDRFSRLDGLLAH